MTTKTTQRASRSASGRVASARAVALTWSTLLLALLLAAGCHGGNQPPESIPSIAPPDARIRFAVIGDYGSAGPDEAAVARLVRGWTPDFVVTTGDNNYPR